MGLIDNILEQTRPQGPVIVSENHDVGNIDWLAGLSDPGEMIRCGYMQEARRQAGESDAAYAERLRTTLTPEQWNELREAVMPAAIARAGLDTSNGRVNVMTAGVPPWHKLGVNVASAVNSEEARLLSGLNFTVSKERLRYYWNGDVMEQDQVYAIVREDTGGLLGVVGSMYKVVQNDEGFAILDNALAPYGAKYATAGSIFGGKKVWMQALLPGSCFSVAGGDYVEAYATFMNPHDGSGQGWVFASADRAVCRNTLRVAMKGNKGYGIRHTGDIKARAAEAATALGMAVQGFEEFRQNADVLASTYVDDINSYFDRVLDGKLELKAADALKGPELLAHEALKDKHDISPDDFTYCLKTAEKAIQSRADILEDLMERYHSERCNVHGIDGTLWAAMNAVTEYSDYGNGKRAIGTETERASRKFESVLHGEADDLKQLAYVEALAMTR